MNFKKFSTSGGRCQRTTAPALTRQDNASQPRRPPRATPMETVPTPQRFIVAIRGPFFRKKKRQPVNWAGRGVRP